MTRDVHNNKQHNRLNRTLRDRQNRTGHVNLNYLIKYDKGQMRERKISGQEEIGQGTGQGARQKKNAEQDNILLDNQNMVTILCIFVTFYFDQLEHFK